MIVEQFAQFGPALEALAMELRSQLLTDSGRNAASSEKHSAAQDKGRSIESQHRSGARLVQVEDAIRRLESGEYGYCTQCEDEISYARLKARPESHLCGRCGAGKA